MSVAGMVEMGVIVGIDIGMTCTGMHLLGVITSQNCTDFRVYSLSRGCHLLIRQHWRDEGALRYSKLAWVQTHGKQGTY